MITTEEHDSENSSNEQCDTKDDLTKSFEVVLKDLPEVLDYIKRLNEHIRKQQTTIVKLFEKIKEFKAQSSCNKVSVGTQTEDDEHPHWNDWNGSTADATEGSLSAWNAAGSSSEGKSLAEEVKQVAESAMLQTGFAYEASSGLYYDYNTGYYYNAELGLYYDGSTGTYVYYNEDSKQFEYHSHASFPVADDTSELTISKTSLAEASADVNTQSTPSDSSNLPQASSLPVKSVPSSTPLTDRKRSKREEVSERKRRREGSPGPGSGHESPEDGEISDSSESNGGCDERVACLEDQTKEAVSEKDRDSPIASPSNDTNDVNNSQPELATAWPPCIRVIVQKTALSNLRVGALFIVTCTGGSLGRETGHAVCVPDINISKHHAKFTFDEADGKYYITDLGSRNGTILDGQRLSSAKQESEPFEVQHGSKIQLGSTVLLCHVHGGNETCGHCEPGVVAALNAATDIGSDSAVPLLSGTKGSQHKQELRRLRRKFGLTSAEAAAESAGASCPAGYEDRAQSRRQTVGSQDDNAKTETASLDQHIKPSNKGFKMLAKMGWVHGQGLGKDGSGGPSTEPIAITQRPDKAGLGVDLDTLPPEVDNRTKRKADVWRKTQQRYKDLPVDTAPDKE